MKPPSAGRSGRNLTLAIASGLALAALFVAANHWSPWALLALVSVIVVIAVAELGAAFGDAGVRTAVPVVIAAGLVMLVGALVLGALGQVLGLLLLVLGAVLWTLWEPPADADSGGGALINLGATLLVGVWVPFLGSFIALLAAREHGSWIVLAVIALTVTNDIAAFGFGAGFGRNKMAPRVSPGKTWEGFTGGLVVVLLLAALVTARLPGFDLTTALVLGLGIVPAATLGDLAESAVKRDLRVKDLGRVVPGHGGIMDRVDAILFALPVAHVLLLLLGE